MLLLGGGFDLRVEEGLGFPEAGGWVNFARLIIWSIPSAFLPFAFAVMYGFAEEPVLALGGFAPWLFPTTALRKFWIPVFGFWANDDSGPFELADCVVEDEDVEKNDVIDLRAL